VRPRARSEPFAACTHDDLPEEEYAYLLGIYLGDGCLSAHPRGVWRLRVACDSQYQQIIDAIGHAMARVRGRGHAAVHQRPGRCVEGNGRSWSANARRFSARAYRQRRLPDHGDLPRKLGHHAAVRAIRLQQSERADPQAVHGLARCARHPLDESELQGHCGRSTTRCSRARPIHRSEGLKVPQERERCICCKPTLRALTLPLDGGLQLRHSHRPPEPAGR
jgi:hypothetical protein